MVTLNDQDLDFEKQKADCSDRHCRVAHSHLAKFDGEGCGRLVDLEDISDLACDKERVL